ncbi:acetyl-CoA carboxylase biotin carboxyl carrier protein [Fulvimarina sp. 2208YS6-2-32]|uniref:Biotin carboxyl carrier protein of acetyl-CoA carboxylase n=1 Tax=Fulvimarina uroteuthidis TaxID=3098149 RepID=A0ABU5I5H0_9HYPH|nr:acetyl-CoA carboxylase biotin carboxyl carrier protein [Fulvimarina sp. 2208YS6-2-32]MDY8110640.1 acetyl-CoA carboxylase biotin carboxyl carrier protein [Fulvimarina sp. 2208YS6-2-32]
MSDKSLDPDIVRELASILKESDLTEIEIERDELRIRLTRQIEAAPIFYQQPQMQMAPAHQPMSAPVAQGGTVPAAPARSGEGTVSSPMVGTVYLAASPGSKSFVEIGQSVKEGDTLCIIEAMKTMNSIPSPRSGTVREVLIENAQPVEFGESLFVID